MHELDSKLTSVTPWNKLQRGKVLVQTRIEVSEEMLLRGSRIKIPFRFSFGNSFMPILSILAPRRSV